MNLEFKFEIPRHSWSVVHVFKKYYDIFLNENKNLKITHVDSSNFIDRFGGGSNSAQVMTITNKTNGKYIVVSYWDKVDDLLLSNNGWDTKNCVEIITSSGVKPNQVVTPFSYLPYTTEFDDLSNKSKSMGQKTKNELIFRGYLYGERLELKELGKIQITDKKIHPTTKYFEDLTNNKICLSLNGAGEICNRDLEILSARSVLLRPKLSLKFHNELIPNYHYVPFEYNKDPKIQSEIILNKFNEIKNNTNLLNFISENGYDWYKKNGTINSNVEILKKIININKLI